MSGAEQNVIHKTSGLAARRAPPAHNLLACVEAHIQKLKEYRLWESSNYRAVWRSIHALEDIALEKVHLRIIVNRGGINALIPYICAPLVEEGRRAIGDLREHAIERKALFLLKLIAQEMEYRLVIVNAGALPHLAALLVRKVMTSANYDAFAVNDVIQEAICIIGILSKKNKKIQDRMREAGFISPLLALLESNETALQKEALETLETLISNNAANRNNVIRQIHGDACPTLIFMLQSDNNDISKAALGAMTKLVEESPADVKKTLMKAGVLKPVVSLLSSSCQDVQSQAMSVLNEFAVVGSIKMPIVQHGAVRPLVKILKATEPRNQVKVLAILGKLAQNTGNHAGIILGGGLKSLLGDLDSTHNDVQVAAAFALCILSQNEENTSDIVQEGGVQLLQGVDFSCPASKLCAQMALKRLKKNTHGRALKRMLYLMRSADEGLRETVACALAYLCSPNNWKSIFLVHSGLNILLDMLNCTFKSSRKQKHGAQALHQLFTTENAFSNTHAVLPLMETPVVHLGEEYLNSTTSSDVTFLVEGIPFCAHKSVLLAASDTFRAMLEGGYREKEASNIPIQNISWNVFALMMRHIYTGTVEVSADEAQDLFQAADQYLLNSLRRLCEGVILEALTVENAAKVYGLARAHQVSSLQHACVLFALEEHEQICSLDGYPEMMEFIIPGIRDYFLQALS